jgi:hypothetical protein
VDVGVVDTVDKSAAHSSAAHTAAAHTAAAARPRLRWWFEILLVLGFYAIYSSIRNTFGSKAVGPEQALDNAERVIDIERAIGLFHEEAIQRAFIGWDGFIKFWNIFYGSFHFVVTLFALLWLFIRFPLRYEKYRNVLLATTGLALIGFSLFPLMPPRLIGECASPYGGCTGGFEFVDTLRRVGGLWSFDSGTVSDLSNQYAAMPSLHFGWSTWCAIALIPTFRSRIVRALLFLYPLLTLFAIVVTANHYWLDAVGGAWVLGMGYLLGTLVTRLSARYRVARAHRLAEARGHLEPQLDPEPQPDQLLA